jgi:hypothetical protein
MLFFLPTVIYQNNYDQSRRQGITSCAKKFHFFYNFENKQMISILCSHRWQWSCQPYTPAKPGELHPVVECNRHNWYSVGVTTSFLIHPEMSHQSVTSVKKNGPCTFSRDTALETLTLRESHWCSIYACGCSVPQIQTLCLFTLPLCGMWLHRRPVFLRNHLPPFSTAFCRKIHTFSLCLLV